MEWVEGDGGERRKGQDSGMQVHWGREDAQERGGEGNSGYNLNRELNVHTVEL